MRNLRSPAILEGISYNVFDSAALFHSSLGLAGLRGEVLRFPNMRSERGGNAARTNKKGVRIVAIVVVGVLAVLMLVHVRLLLGADSIPSFLL